MQHKHLFIILTILLCASCIAQTNTPTPTATPTWNMYPGMYVYQFDFRPGVIRFAGEYYDINPLPTATPTWNTTTPTSTPTDTPIATSTFTPLPTNTCCAPFSDKGTYIEMVDPSDRINFGSTGIPGYRFVLNWRSGDAIDTVYVGSSNASNNRTAVMAESYSGYGFMGISATLIGGHFSTLTGTAGCLGQATQTGSGVLALQLGNTNNTSSCLEIRRSLGTGYTGPMILINDQVGSDQDAIRYEHNGSEKYRVSSVGQPYVNGTPVPLVYLNTPTPPPTPAPTLNPNTAQWNANKIQDYACQSGAPGNKDMWQYSLLFGEWRRVQLDPTVTPLPATPTLIPTLNPNTAIWNANEIHGYTMESGEPQENDYWKFDGNDWLHEQPALTATPLPTSTPKNTCTPMDTCTPVNTATPVDDSVYLLADGTRDLTGNWTISTNDIILTSGDLLLTSGAIKAGSGTAIGDHDLYDATGCTLAVGAASGYNATVDLMEGSTGSFGFAGSYGARMMYYGRTNKWYLQMGNQTTEKSAIVVLRNSGYVGILDTTPSQELDVNGDVRADSYIEYSKMYTGDALAAIRNIKAKEQRGNKKWKDVDHSTLPAGVMVIVKDKYVRDKQTGKIKGRAGHGHLPEFEDEGEQQRWELAYEVVEIDTPCRDVGASVQLNLRAIQQLDEIIIRQQKQINMLLDEGTRWIIRIKELEKRLETLE